MRSRMENSGPEKKAVKKDLSEERIHVESTKPPKEKKSAVPSRIQKPKENLVPSSFSSNDAAALMSQTPNQKGNKLVRTSNMKTAVTPKRKINLQENLPAQANPTKSASKQSWKRRPMAAHSGVPVPEKMRKIMEQLQFKDIIDL